MKWSKKVPRKDGYYWARGLFTVAVGTIKEIIEPVQIIGNDIEEPEVLSIGKEMSLPTSAYTHWSPIKLPKGKIR